MNEEKEGKSLMTYKLGKLPINQELALCCFCIYQHDLRTKTESFSHFYINHSLQNRTSTAQHLFGLLVPDYTA